MLQATPKPLLLVVLVGVAAAPAVLMMARRLAARASGYRGPLLDPLSPWVGLPLLYALVYGLGALELSGWEEYIPPSEFGVYLSGLVAYLAGVGLATGLLPSRGAGGPPRSAGRGGTEALAILVLFAATAAIGFLVLLRAGNPLLASDIETARTQVVVDVGGWLYYLYRTQAVALLLLIAAWYRTDGGGRLLLAALIAVSVLLILSSGYRSHLVVPLGAAVVFRHYFVKPLSPVTLGLIVGVVLAFLVVFGAFRLAGVGGGGDVMRKMLVEIQNPAFALARVREVFPEQFPHFGGLYMFRGFLALLPGEQIAIGLVLKEMLGLHYAGGGFAPSILGGFYIDFGLPGVIGGMFFCGLVVAGFFQAMRRRPSFYNVLLYAYLTVYLAFSIRGGFLQEVFPLWFFFILLVLRSLFERGRRGYSLTRIPA